MTNDEVREGLKDLVRVIEELGVRSIAVLALGCGNGGLDWAAVKVEMEAALGVLKNVEVVVFALVGEGNAWPVGEA